LAPHTVVVVGVHAQNALEKAAAEDQHPIETVAADGSYPTLSVGIRIRSLDRRPDHFDPLGAKDLVEAVGFTNSIAVEIGQIHAPDRIYAPYGRLELAAPRPRRTRPR
jgi:hypothetical protein